ncbi:MAG: PQQ-binding-like beta-propeller repeat protein [Planctomycetota bacterium]
MKRLLRPLFVLTLIAFLLPDSAQAQWPTGVGGRANRDGRSLSIGPNNPTIRWSGSLSAIVAQQAVIEDDLVVTNRIGSFTIPTGTWIVAHELTNGNIRWQKQLPMSFADSWRSRVTAIRDGQVYATRSGNTNAEYLYALSPIDGSQIWQSQDLIDETTTESLAFAPNGDIITSGPLGLLRINHVDGSTMWSSPRTCPTSGGCDAVVRNGKVYIWQAGGMGPVVTAFDVNTGANLYSSAGILGGIVQQVGLMVGPDGTVYAPRTQNNPATDYLVALQDTGSSLIEKWRYPIGYPPFASHAVAPDGSVYTYSRNVEIVRLDPASGAVLNTSPVIVTDFLQPRIAIDAEGKIFFTNGGFTQGTVYSFNADLTLRWSQAVTNVNVGGPALSEDGTLVVCGVGTDVRAYQDPCTGSIAEYGVGTPGSAGIEPKMVVSGCPTPGGKLAVSITGGLGGASATFALGFGQGTANVTPNCTVQILPLSPILFSLPLDGTVPGEGERTILVNVPPGAPNTTVYVQGFVQDPGEAFGLAATKPVAVTVQ